MTVAGKKYKIKLVAKDDAYDASRTVTNVKSLLSDDHVFALLNVVGTKNNLAIRNLVNTQCVPDLFAASGATQWGNHQYPWLIGSELVPYPLEVKRFVDYLKADEARRDDRGAEGQRRLRPVVRRHAHAVGEGHEAQDRADPAVRQHRRRGRHAGEQPRRHEGRRVLPRRDAARLPGGAHGRRTRGWHPIIYMSGTCVSKVLFSIAGPPANGVFSVTPLLDPASPANATNPALKLYRAQVAKYKPKADLDDGIVGYGWTHRCALP